MDLELLRRRPWRLWVWLVPAVLLAGAMPTRAADYHDSQARAQRLARLAEREPDLVRVHELATSRGGRAVSLVEVGAGSDEDRGARPALLVVAGIEGNDLVGPFTALAWVERLMEQYQADAATAEMLKTTTIYVVPCLNPDATDLFFVGPKVERSGNGTPCDDDHDGLVDEDGGEDLNGDGLITQMRVEDKEGEYALDPNEGRLLFKADPVKGETGAWKLLPEGTDNDHDKRWNEDGPGAVNLNRNFPYGYKYFAPDAGLHMVCEAETRALADFVVGHPNIGLVLTYGEADNLRQAPKGAESPGRSKPMEAVDEKDVGWYEAMGKLYRKALRLGTELEGASEPGTFSDWMYFHRGRLSLAARPWDVALARDMAREADEPNEAQDKEEAEDESANMDRASESEGDDPEKDPNEAAERTPDAEETTHDDKPTRKDKEEADKRREEEREQLQWFDEHAPEAFVAWQAIEHPDFPGRRVEVGGYRPFALRNPPAEMLGGVAARHGDFLTALAQRLPHIKLGKVECHVLADSLYEIEILVTNVGFLPTALAHGVTCQEVHPTRVILDLEPQCFLAGKRTTFLPTMQGSGGTAKVRYTIHIANRREIRFEIISMLGGRVDGTIELLKDE